MEQAAAPKINLSRALESVDKHFEREMSNKEIEDLLKELNNRILMHKQRLEEIDRELETVVRRRRDVLIAMDAAGMAVKNLRT